MIRKNCVNRVRLEAEIYKTIERTNNGQHLHRIRASFSDIVVRFYGSFRTKRHIFLVLEYCANGDISKLLDKCGSLSEEWAR